MVNLKIMDLSMISLPEIPIPNILYHIVNSLPTTHEKLLITVDARHILELHRNKTVDSNIKPLENNLHSIELTILNRKRREYFGFTHNEFDEAVPTMFQSLFPKVTKVAIRCETTVAIYHIQPQQLHKVFLVIAKCFNLHIKKRHPSAPANSCVNILTFPLFLQFLVHLRIRGNSTLEDVLKAAVEAASLDVNKFGRTSDFLESLMVLPEGKWHRWTPHFHNLLKHLRNLKNLKYLACSPYFGQSTVGITEMMGILRQHCPRLQVLKIINLNVRKYQMEGLDEFRRGLTEIAVNLRAMATAAIYSRAWLLLEDGVPWDIKNEWVAIARAHGLQVLSVYDPFATIGYNEHVGSASDVM
ncbi:hypothetical protein HDU76_008731 [Blyttiomyces sp. JEL0837]|nr:hypothetical protein HDU76_008731 [Blyttiomyces sp. JEL0837]